MRSSTAPMALAASVALGPMACRRSPHSPGRQHSAINIANAMKPWLPSGLINAMTKPNRERKD